MRDLADDFHPSGALGSDGLKGFFTINVLGAMLASGHLQRMHC